MKTSIQRGVSAALEVKVISGIYWWLLFVWGNPIQSVYVKETVDLFQSLGFVIHDKKLFGYHAKTWNIEGFS